MCRHQGFLVPLTEHRKSRFSVILKVLGFSEWWISITTTKSLQSCLILCDPIDGSPPGSRPWDSPGKNVGVGCHFLLQCMKVKSGSEVAQSCPTLSDPMDCSPPGSSTHGIFQARVLEWGAIAFSEISISFKFITSYISSLQESQLVLWNFEVRHWLLLPSSESPWWHLLPIYTECFCIEYLLVQCSHFH